MINFGDFNLVIDDTYSFVGVKKENGSLNFYIPKGFSECISDNMNFEQKRNLFFLMYRTLREFKKICIQKGYIEDSSPLLAKDRDGVIRSQSGAALKSDSDEEDLVFYSKIDLISDFLETYDEVKILSLNYKTSKSQNIDISKIYKYLHKAIYLPNNAAYLDEMLIPRNSLEFEANDIVLIYCYLYDEIKCKIQEDKRLEIEVLAERFRQKYLSPQDGLFEELSFKKTKSILRDTLAKINDFTAVKNHDYWHFYDATEAFLYGDWSNCEEGEIWGIKNFHSVWESMCLTYLVKQYGPSGSLFHIDSRYIKTQVLEDSVSHQEKIQENKEIFRINGRQLIPDAIVQKTLIHQIYKSVENINYSIWPNRGWNDYGYHTIFKGGTDDDIRIGYKGQDGSHTFEKLSEIFPDGTIWKRLNDEFYSFWKIDEKEDIDLLYLHKMMTFNHLFFLALERNIQEWDTFRNKILVDLGANSQLRHNSPQENVFSHSLLRYFCVEGSIDKLRESFECFVKRISKFYINRFDIIDAKYLEESYFFDKTKVKEIKKRSVLKQFVYEYLLEDHFSKNIDQVSELEVSSIFWLPFYASTEDSNFSCLGQSFMNGFIKIEKINFNKVLNFYLSES